MAFELAVLSDANVLASLGAEWRELAAHGGAGTLFRGPDWLLPWWRAYHTILDAQMFAVVGRDDGQLVCMAPLYRRTVKTALFERHEIRMMGDAGPRPPALDVLCKPGIEDRAGSQVAKLLAETPGWDLIDLEPLADPSPFRAHLMQRLATQGLAVETSSAGGARRIALGRGAAHAGTTGLQAVQGADAAALRRGLSALRRLSRLEWAEREETSPLADDQSSQLLEEVSLSLGADGRARLGQCADPSGEAVAVALIVDDADRAVVLAMAADPEWISRGVVQKLLSAEALAASMRGRVALDVVTGAAEYPLPPLPMSPQGAISVRIWANTKTASVSRTYRSVARGARVAREAPGAAAAQARAAWSRIRSAAAGVTHYHRMQLYRGQLWTSGIVSTGVEVGLFSLADYEAMAPDAAADLRGQLELDDATIRANFGRGDMAILARFGARAAGIAWAARGPVEVPELGRTLRLTKYEAYIHNVFVASSARGRAVAPMMLEKLNLELRQHDVYRCWALIGSDNQASIRAFRKASYTPVCEVISAHIGSHGRLVLKPPDAEARELFGEE